MYFLEEGLFVPQSNELQLFWGVPRNMEPVTHFLKNMNLTLYFKEDES